METTINKITATNKQVGKQTLAHLNNLTKPPGSLGRLEKLAVQLAEITGDTFPTVSPPASIVFAGDHGIAKEGVSAFPQEVTTQMVANFLAGGAAINVLTKQIDAMLEIVDIGVASDIEGSGFINKKIRYGTANFAKEDAMTRKEAQKAIEVGIDIVKQVIKQGANSIILGEMGIGNTTSSSAIIATLAEVNVEGIVDIGTGITAEQRVLKRKIIAQALEDRKPNREDVLDILSKIGGLEIAGMTGAILGAASERKPVIIDGFICTVSALLATKLVPEARDYLIFSHRSQEQGHTTALKMLQANPLLDLELRLGEGTGAALAFPIVESSLKILKGMATFTSAGIST
ncbi:nicotinate-nucleotide--dimethylbenzimidazole phosphoribosyltransferase [Salipaludibacillus sp. HK11]|uniref:nicotinate-nucleotide--dimethylbenzimidazole phosphoribosyltransferase n=1 Tax=Salipaludibacillus sp. HK11 TaxID=3394320 RepID=UPI0039FD0B4D